MVQTNGWFKHDMMTLFGFKIYVIGLVYSNFEKEKLEISNTLVLTNRVNVDGILYFVDGGSVYRWNGLDWTDMENWQKNKLP